MPENNKKMVVVWGDECILCSSVQRILADKQEWIVIGVSNINDFNSLIFPDDIDPSDIVIIQQEDTESPCEPQTQFLYQQKGIRLITISLESNVMTVYDRKSLEVKNPDDLIYAIESGTQHPQGITNLGGEI
jgi:hypothetical protein